jgi:hypothetical protein
MMIGMVVVAFLAATAVPLMMPMNSRPLMDHRGLGIDDAV